MKGKRVDWKKNEQRGRVKKKSKKKMREINEEANKKVSVKKKKKERNLFNTRKRTIK